jgi:Galactose oxidase-like, Early set domain
VARVAILRCVSVTHAFSSDRRYVGLNFEVTPGHQLRVQMPMNTNIAPPGYYLLFVVDTHGIPSVGRFVQVGD